MKNINININIKLFIISLIYFFFSFLVFSYFDGGDQKFYREFYSGIYGYSFFEGFDYYLNTLGTGEPIYFFIVYLFSSFLEKDVLFSVINSIFICLIFKFFMEKKVPYFIQFLLAFNFYLFVLLFSAERLKLALLFFIISIGRPTIGSLFLQLLAFFTHVQTLLLIAQPYLEKFFLAKRKYLLSAKILVLTLFFFFILSGVIFIMREHIMGKLENYHGDLYSIIKPLIFMISSILCAKNKKKLAFSQSLIFVVFSYFVGEERIVIFSYFIFMYYGLQYKNGKNIYVLLSSLYFFYKGLVFLQNTFYFGDGFDPKIYLQ